MEKGRTTRKVLSLEISKKIQNTPVPTSKSASGLIRPLEEINSSNVQIIETHGSLPSEFERRFEIIEKLGKGSQGIVYLVKSKENEELLAAKVYNTFDEETISKIQNEKTILSKLNHKLFPTLKTFIEDADLGYYIIITEFCRFESLEAFMSCHYVDSLETLLILTQIEEALKILHSNNISHRDFNPTNILIDPATCAIKIIDFGLSKIVKNSEKDKEMDLPEGNQKYRAPECNSLVGAFFEDFWGFACIVLGLYCHRKINSKKMVSFLNGYKKNKNNFEGNEEIAKIMEKLLLVAFI